MSLYERFRRRDRRALARLITHIENRKNGYRRLLAAMATTPGHAHRIGITGPPGAGKSTLVDQIVAAYAEEGNEVGVIAIDPSSPFTGGALLGDRIRMSQLINRKNVFIRSMASRGKSGGLAAATRDTITAFAAFGMDLIIVETVGIGQIELDIIDVCDTVVVVLVPESGDIIQTMKAGLMEIADIFCVNKIDREGAERLIVILDHLIHERLAPDGRAFPVVGTSGLSGEGIETLIERIAEHRQYITETGKFAQRRRRQLRSEIMDNVKERIARHLERQVEISDELDRMVDELAEGMIDPYRAADRIYDQYFHGRLTSG